MAPVVRGRRKTSVCLAGGPYKPSFGLCGVVGFLLPRQPAILQVNSPRATHTCPRQSLRTREPDCQVIPYATRTRACDRERGQA